MELAIDVPTVVLAAGQVLTLDDAAGRRIMARGGVVWVTEEDCRQDHIVGPGESLVLTRGGRTLVQALQPAWVTIQ